MQQTPKKSHRVNRKVYCPAPNTNDIVSVPNVEVKHLRQRVTDNNSLLGKFMWCDKLEKGTGLAFDDKNNIRIDKFKIIDSSDIKHVIAYDDQSNHVCIFAKVSRQHSSRRSSGKRPVKRLCSFGMEISRCMQNTNRGQ